jgi:hypothetical protein
MAYFQEGYLVQIAEKTCGIMNHNPKGNEMETTEVTEISMPSVKKTSCLEMASTATTVIQLTVAVGSLALFTTELVMKARAARARKRAAKAEITTVEA